MGTKNSIRNAFATSVVNIISIVVGLVAQAVFINILGKEYLGINGLFTNIISMLGIVELGIGSAIIYNLYKPIKNKDYETINSLMKYYKKAYNIIAIVVLLLGISIIPVLPFFIKEVTVDINLTIVYILFILDIVCSYIVSYKRSILYADQKNYIINIIHMLYYILLNVLQLSILYFTQNYYIYLIIKIVMRLVENYVIKLYVDSKYKYLNVNNAKVLDSEIRKDIVKKVKALFFHKIAGFFVLGTDNIIISKYIGLITVGLYSNYYMIIEAVNKVFGQAITALTPSVGHMLVDGNTEKSFNVFKKVRFANFWIACFTSISILLIVDSFITLWIGSEFVLDKFVLYVLVFNFYQKMMRNSYSTFKEAAGIYYEDRFVPIIESILNIVVSIVLVKLIGLPGVFLGTIISGLALWCYSYPKFVYKKLFNRNYINYAKETIGYILLFVAIAVISVITTNIYIFDNTWLEFIKNIGLALIVPNIMVILVFCRTENFKYYKNLIIELIKKGVENGRVRFKRSI